jgi:hypothetical protein
MLTLINNALITCSALAFLLAMFDFVRQPSWRRPLIYASVVGAIVLGLLLRTERQAFGGTSQLLGLGAHVWWGAVGDRRYLRL